MVWRGAVERQLRAAETLTPFTSPDDAMQRLIAYHLHQDADRRPDADAAAFTSWPLVLSHVQHGSRQLQTAQTAGTYPWCSTSSMLYYSHSCVYVYFYLCLNAGAICLIF